MLNRARRAKAALSLLVVIALTPLVHGEIIQTHRTATVRHTESSGLQKGIQIDISRSDGLGTPSTTQLTTLDPTWIRFDVHHVRCGDLRPTRHGIETTGIWAHTKWLVEFDNQEYPKPPKAHGAARKDSCAGTSPPPPLLSGDVSAWVNYFVHTYLPDLTSFLNANVGEPIGAVEIWNEEDLGFGKSPTPRQAGMPPAAYAYLVRHAAHIIAGYNAHHHMHVKSVMGGLAMGDPGYIDAVLAADPGCLTQVSAVGLHPYTRNPWNGQLAATITSYRAHTSLPIWITEVGHEDVPFGQTAENQRWQGHFLAAMFGVFSAMNIPVAIWYAWSDDIAAFGNANKIKHSFGLYDSKYWDGNEQLKPSGLAFSRLNSSRDNATVHVSAGPVRPTRAGFVTKIAVVVSGVPSHDVPRGMIIEGQRPIALDASGRATFDRVVVAGRNAFAVRYSGDLQFNPGGAVWGTATLSCHNRDLFSDSVLRSRHEHAIALGGPLSGGCVEVTAGGGGLALFQRGLVTVQPNSAHSVYVLAVDSSRPSKTLAIVNSYEAQGGPASRLGYPESRLQQTGTGFHVAFQKGYMYDSSLGGLVTLLPVKKLETTIMRTYLQLSARAKSSMGAGSALAYPKGGFVITRHSTYLDFVRGSISATPHQVTVCVNHSGCKSTKL